MLIKLLRYSYRLLALVIVGVPILFSLFFLSTSSWGDRLGQAWFLHHVASLNLLQVLIERHLHLTFLWVYVIVPWLKLPIWAAVLILITLAGLLFMGLQALYRKLF